MSNKNKPLEFCNELIIYQFRRDFFIRKLYNNEVFAEFIKSNDIKTADDLNNAFRGLYQDCVQVMLENEMSNRLKLQKASESFEKNYPDKDDNEYVSNLTEDIKFAENSKYTIYNEKGDWVPYSEVLDRRIGYIDKVYETYVTDYNPNAEDKERIHEKFENYKKGMRFFLMGLEEETYMGIKSISVNRDLDFIDAVYNLLYE